MHNAGIRAAMGGRQPHVCDGHAPARGLRGEVWVAVLVTQVDGGAGGQVHLVSLDLAGVRL